MFDILCVTLNYASNFSHHKTTKIVLYNYLLVELNLATK